MNLAKLHTDLLRWYKAEKRDLPWRKTCDPYKVWLSEIMLQQTRVETVIPYYNRFLSHFPGVTDLAAADIDTVTNLWAGLGYYSRARNLHAAAKQVVAAGGFPHTYEGLLKLKGVGEYTAAAIASISLDDDRIALDGNLERVFARLLASREDPKSKAGRAPLFALGQELVSRGSAGSINQCVMDIASSICKPRVPQCLRCPIATHCEARRLGVQNVIPAKRAKPEKILVRAEAWAVVAERELLLARRPEGSWLAGMWDLPWRVEKEGTERAQPFFGVARGEAEVTRMITKHKISFHVKGLSCARRPGAKALESLCAEADEFRWVPLDELHGINLPRPSEKALDIILPALH